MVSGGNYRKLSPFSSYKSPKDWQRLKSSANTDGERMSPELLLLSAAGAGEPPAIFVKAAKQTLTLQS